MRIAVYSHYFLPEIGAPSARIGDFARQWLADGHEVHVATCFPNHPTGRVYPGYSLRRYQHESLQGINVHRSWTYVTPNKGILKKTLGHATFWGSAAFSSTRRIPAPACAIGTSPTFFAAMAARTCARKHRVPYIMEVRDLWPAIFVDLGVIRNRAVIRALEVWEMNLYRTAARIVTVTESFRQNLIKRGLPPTKVVTITNGADTDYWQPVSEGAEALRRELGLQGQFVVLYIGAHGISQGLGAVIKVAERLRSERGLRFLFVGEGADKDKLSAEVNRLGLSNVSFLDPVNKARVRDFYAMADLSLVPLRNIPLFDTFIPSKMFEIMAVGRPILASVRGEAADILRRSGGALVVEPEDDAGLAQALLNLREDSATRDQMGRQGRAFVEAHFSRQELARRYLDVIGAAREEMGLKGTP
jgi:glycosyltransferase involved in cell wall biosynthesis